MRHFAGRWLIYGGLLRHFVVNGGTHPNETNKISLSTVSRVSRVSRNPYVSRTKNETVSGTVSGGFHEG